METLSVREYRSNLAASFAKADKGEKVFIRRKNEIYALVKVGHEDITVSPESQTVFEKRIKAACAEVKAHMEGRNELPLAKDIVF